MLKYPFLVYPDEEVLIAYGKQVALVTDYISLYFRYIGSFGMSEAYHNDICFNLSESSLIEYMDSYVKHLSRNSFNFASKDLVPRTHINEIIDEMKKLTHENESEIRKAQEEYKNRQLVERLHES